MKIEVFGSGCPNCKKLFERTQAAVLESGLASEVEYITDIKKMIGAGIMQAPALVINKQIVVAGRVPGVDEIKKILANF